MAAANEMTTPAVAAAQRLHEKLATMGLSHEQIVTAIDATLEVVDELEAACPTPPPVVDDVAEPALLAELPIDPSGEMVIHTSPVVSPALARLLLRLIEDDRGR